MPVLIVCFGGRGVCRRGIGGGGYRSKYSVGACRRLAAWLGAGHRPLFCQGYADIILPPTTMWRPCMIYEA